MAQPIKPVKNAGADKRAPITPSLPPEAQMPFGMLNYLICGGGLLMVILGFYLMAGEKFIDAKEYSRALYVAPPVIIIGFAVIAVGIMINPSRFKKSNAPANEKADGGIGQ